MNQFLAFTKKEFIEQTRSYKLLIVLILCFVIGLISPLLAKLTPEILSSIDMEGIQINIADPTVLDAYTQFFKNVVQMGLIVIMIMFSFVLSQEITKGTLVNVLSKGLSRKIVILSKYFSSLLTWTMGYIIAVISNFGYTYYLFHEVMVDNIFISLLGVWIFGALVLAIIEFSSVLISGNFGPLIITFVFVMILYIINIIPAVTKFNPVILISNNMDIITNVMNVDNFYMAGGITILLSVVFLFLSISLFNKKKI